MRDDLDNVRPASGFTRVSLGRRIAAELDARVARSELSCWHTTTGHALMYVVCPGEAGRRTPPVLRMTPGECADWLGLDVMS